MYVCVHKCLDFLYSRSTCVSCDLTSLKPRLLFWNAPLAVGVSDGRGLSGMVGELIFMIRRI